MTAVPAPIAPAFYTIGLTIYGPPVTKKNSARIVRRKDGTPFILPSNPAAKWTEKAVDSIHLSFRHPAITAPVSVRALVYREKRWGDLVNYLQAIADALEASELIENDRQIVSWDGSRLLHDKHNPRVELRISPFEEAT